MMPASDVPRTIVSLPSIVGRVGECSSHRLTESGFTEVTRSQMTYVEGSHYYGAYMCLIVWWCQIEKTAFGIGPFQKPFFSKGPDYRLYIAPPGSPDQGLGEFSFVYDAPRSGGFMDYFIREIHRTVSGGGHAAYWAWYANEWRMPPEGEHPGDSINGGIITFLRAANLGPRPEPKPPTDLPQSKVFHGIGQADLHKTILSALDDVHFLFKSSPYGRQSHGRNPQNVFQLVGYGDILLQERCMGACSSDTRLHNTVLINGEEQIPAQSKQARGEIGESLISPELDYIVGDATPAYGGKFKRFRRHVAFVKPELIVMWDELVAAQAATQEKKESLDVLTVMKVCKSGAKAAWTANRVDSPSALGAKVHLDGRIVLVGFRKSGQTAGKLEGVQFSGSVCSKKL
jgi:hypothetical protein